MTCHWPPAWRLEDCRQELLRIGFDWSDFNWYQYFPGPYKLHWVSYPKETVKTNYKPYRWELNIQWTRPKLEYDPNL